MKNPLQTQKTNVPDPLYCTYWWIIYLKSEARTNPNLEHLTGYSKMQYQAENQSKVNCIIAKINMLEKNNWIAKSTHIEIYKKNAGELPNKSKDLLILDLFNHDYSIPPNLINWIPYELKKYLKDFYEARNGNATTKALIPLPDKTKSKDDLFVLSKHNFKSVKDLVSWCELQVQNGEARILVENFYRKYLPKLV